MRITASRLFGKNKTVGDERCFYCGTECKSDPEMSVKKKVSSTFTNHDAVAHPSYAMLSNGSVERKHIRVAEIGDIHGNGIGREEWERYYYGEEIRKIKTYKINSGKKKNR